MAIGNTNGEDLMAAYIGSAYDNIKFVADNLADIKAISVDIDAVTAAVSVADADVVKTTADVVTTNADVVLTAADVVLAAKWATEVEDVLVNATQYSAMHWAIKAAASASGIASILGTANAFTNTNSFTKVVTLLNDGNVTAPLEMTSTGAVGVKLTSAAAVRYLGIDTAGALRYGTNVDIVSNGVVWTAADINSSSLAFAASVLTVATSATVAGSAVLTAATAGTSGIDWAAKDMVVATSLTIGGNPAYTSANSNTSAVDWSVKDLVVAGTASITGVIVAGAVPTLDTHLCNKLYVDAQIQAGSVTYNDNVKLLLGTGNDLEIFHTGVSSNITNNTGNLVMTNASVGDDISLAVTCDDANLDTVLTVQAGATAGLSNLTIRFGDLEKLKTAVDGVEVTGVVSATVAPTDNDHLTRKDYVDTELTNQTHTMSEVSGNLPVAQVPVAVNNAAGGNGFGGFRYTTADAGATLNLFTT